MAPIIPSTSGCDANILRNLRARVRAAPSVQSAQMGLLEPGALVRIIAAEPGQDGLPFRWAKISAPITNGYVREDLLNFTPDCAALGFGSVPPPPPPGSPSCDASVRGNLRAKVRAAPSIQSQQVGFLEPNTLVRITAAEPGQDGLPFRWAKITALGLNGYVREDLMLYSPECSVFGLTSPGQPPAPPSGPLNPQVKFMTPLRDAYTVYQEFGDTRFGPAHRGIDLTRPPGVPIYATGKGVVAYIMRCTRCTDTQPNFLSQGIASWDARAIADPAWGYGFGNHVVVRYAWTDLPSSMRTAMTAQNLTNGFAYVIYGHMQRLDVANGATVNDGTVLGQLGNTGNSTGPHVHVEVRASPLANDNNIFNRPLFNPRVMFDF